MKKKKELSIDPFVLVFIVIVACGLATFIIPPGILENGVYTALPRNAVNFNNLFNISLTVNIGMFFHLFCKPAERYCIFNRCRKISSVNILL